MLGLRVEEEMAGVCGRELVSLQSSSRPSSRKTDLRSFFIFPVVIKDCVRIREPSRSLSEVRMELNLGRVGLVAGRVLARWGSAVDMVANIDVEYEQTENRT